MPELFHTLINNKSDYSHKIAVTHLKKSWTYHELINLIDKQAHALLNLHLPVQARIAVYLPKQIESITSLFAVSTAGYIFVPMNPALKTPQVIHILQNCSVSVLITSLQRFTQLKSQIQHCTKLQTVVITDNIQSINDTASKHAVITWQTFINNSTPTQKTRKPTVIASDTVAILYTSGSTGLAKGVMLSHLNLVTATKSVVEYLNITHQDRLLAVLPFSFDYGLNQLTTCLYTGASCFLHNYLLANDVIDSIARYKITGLAGVPSLFSHIIRLNWPKNIDLHLRYLSNSGGKLPVSSINSLKKLLPKSQIFLMYGLTEAFRSTYLSPAEIKNRPHSIGKAIPNARILIVNKDGGICKAGEIGELVHCGPLVSQGYWNNPEETAKRYKPEPLALSTQTCPPTAVWSGDYVYADAEGYLYFVGRRDDMIKTSGYRVSPTEIEEQLYHSTLINEAVAFGVKHAVLGQAIIAVASPAHPHVTEKMLAHYCRTHLANFMQPEKIILIATLPKTAHGKIDKPLLMKQFNNDTLRLSNTE